MSEDSMHPFAQNLRRLTSRLGATTTRDVERDANGRIVGMSERPTDTVAVINEVSGLINEVSFENVDVPGRVQIIAAAADFWRGAAAVATNDWDRGRADNLAGWLDDIGEALTTDDPERRAELTDFFREQAEYRARRPIQ